MTRFRHHLIAPALFLIVVQLTCLANGRPRQQQQQQQQQHEPDLLQLGSSHRPPTGGWPDQQTDLARLNTYQYTRQLAHSMQVHKLSPDSNNITCNDGSPIGYYMRLNSLSKSWIIYLQGGGFCGTDETCRRRLQHSPQLMSSHHWPKSKSLEGILSSDPKENPYLWNANHVYLPYCSSDSWSGASHANQTTSGLAFLGSKILERVLDSLYDDLAPEASLNEAKFILLAGDSAGATGVILNLDRVSSLVERRAAASRASCRSNPDCEQAKQTPILRGLADSGWFLDNEPYDFDLPNSEIASDSPDELDCDHQRCTPLQSIRQAMRLWNGQVPEACSDAYQSEPWRCYFGYRAYQTLRTPLFVVQWLYDEAQLMVNNIIRPGTRSQWNYVHKLANKMRQSLENVTAVFAPSCFSHSLVAKRTWNQININGLKLPHILNSWEEQSLTSNVISPGHFVVQSNLAKYPDETGPRAAMPNQDEASQAGHFTVNQHDRLSNHLNNPNSTGHSQQASFEALVASPDQEALQPNQQQQQPSPVLVAPIHVTDHEHLQLRASSHDYVAASTAKHGQTGQGGRSRARKRKRNNRRREPASQHESRLGRSTGLDDSVVVLNNNNVPDETVQTNSPPLAYADSFQPTVDNSRWTFGVVVGQESRPISSRAQHTIRHMQPQSNQPDRFRLIDSCGLPQCNRDCPVMDSDPSSGGVLLLS